MAEDTERWAKVIKVAGVKVDSSFSEAAALTAHPEVRVVEAGALALERRPVMGLRPP